MELYLIELPATIAPQEVINSSHQLYLGIVSPITNPNNRMQRLANLVANDGAFDDAFKK
jgi:hypothetical protein